MSIQARTEFAAAINQIASEKGVETEVIIEAIKAAALAAYRKDLSFRNESVPDDLEELEVKIDGSSGEITIFRGKDNITPPGFARIAAQTAKQVITQKLHEAEKGAIVSEYEQKVGTVISGAIQRQEGNTFFVDLGRAEGILPPSEQIRDEYMGQNQRMKFFIKEIRETGRGPEVVVSRSDPGLVKGLFAMEVPEIQSGVVEIKEIAREAGGRCKVAVSSNQEGVDPVGSMVGQKGVRVQAVINELGEEKIDIIMHSSDPERFIASSLSPAKDVQVSLNEEEKIAKVKIPDAQLSLAIGKGGQNVRLAAKLTGYKIDIEGTGEGLEERKTEEEKAMEADKKAAEAKVEEEVEKEEVSEAPAGAVKSQKEKGKIASENSKVEEKEEAVEEEAAGEKTEEVVEESAESKEVEKIEENIDDAVKEESLDGAIQEEPTAEEAAPAAAQAEADMSEDPEMNERSSSANEKPEENAPVEGVADEAEFDKVEEERNKKEVATKSEESKE